VRHQVAHQGVDDIRINFHCYSNRCYSVYCTGSCAPLLILRFATAILNCMIKRIKFLGIPVRNQDQALKFYTEKLGFRILTDQPFSENQRWIELSIPGAETGIVLFTPEGHEDRIGTFVNTSWEVDGVEKTYSDLQNKGVEFTGPPQKQPWGTFVIMKDSEGNQIVLSSR
jgi:predicted enzyme related to lactoylglutathione lyase